MIKINLKNKVVLITGGYRGIGSVFAKTYAKANAVIFIAARKIKKCEKVALEWSQKYSTTVKAVFLDVSDINNVKKVIDAIKDEYGHIDILVNAAGISGIQKPTIELTNGEFDEVFNIDFKGTLFVSQEVAKIMIAQNSGKIINIASILGKTAAPYMTGYCVSKSAVIQLTKVLALELAKYNIQVNVVCPGYFLTDINKAFFESERGKTYIKEKIPLKRVGNVDELESTALYLATAPAFLTGSEVVIDGAQTII